MNVTSLFRTLALAWAAVFAGPPALELHAQQQRASTELPTDAPLQVASSIRLPAGVHVRPARKIAPDGPSAVLWARGARNVVIDLGSARLVGAGRELPADRLEGAAIHLEDCENVSVRGGSIEGYKFGIVAVGCRGVRVEGVRFDHLFRERLLSTALAADDDDQLSRESNDQGEWLERYGAAIALRECTAAVVTGCRVRHAQNGLVLSRCSGALAYGNDFSFLSGWGIALFRSSDNKLVRNRCDACVRGFVHNVYARELGAAGILLTERCSDNLIAENLARGCGDGLSLYGGLDLVEGRAAARGELAAGGCDRNLILRNDFSAALDCGIELEFSRENRVLENVADDCLGCGLRASFCERTIIAENSACGAAQYGVSIAHGQESWLARNVIERCGAGLEFTFDASSPHIAGAFGRSRDSASRDHWVWNNAFASNAADFRIRSTSGLRFRDNAYEPRESELLLTNLTLAPGEAGDAQPRELLRGVGGFLPSGSVVDASVRAAPEEPPKEFTELDRAPAFELPGEPWKSAPQFELARVRVGEWGPWDLDSDESGPPLRPVGGALAGCVWDVAWISWKDGVDPRAVGPAEWRESVRAGAQQRAELSGLNDPWGNLDQVRATIGETHFGLVATTRVKLAAGRYRLRVTSDDGVRVRIGQRRVSEDWTWHPVKVRETLLELEAGEHEFSVDYFQVDGGAALALDLLQR